MSFLQRHLIRRIILIFRFGKNHSNLLVSWELVTEGYQGRPVEMHKTADFHSNLLVSWELVAEGYQGRSVKCTKQLISTQIC